VKHIVRIWLPQAPRRLFARECRDLEGRCLRAITSKACHQQAPSPFSLVLAAGERSWVQRTARPVGTCRGCGTAGSTLFDVLASGTAGAGVVDLQVLAGMSSLNGPPPAFGITFDAGKTGVWVCRWPLTVRSAPAGGCPFSLRRRPVA